MQLVLHGINIINSTKSSTVKVCLLKQYYCHYISKVDHYLRLNIVRNTVLDICLIQYTSLGRICDFVSSTTRSELHLIK